MYGRGPDVVDLDEVVVVEARGSPRLAQESLASGLIPSRVATHQLDRHFAIEKLVAGLPHSGHPAAAELALEDVATLVEGPRWQHGEPRPDFPLIGHEH